MRGQLEGVGQRDTGMFFSSETLVRSEVFGNYKVALITEIFNLGSYICFLSCLYIYLL